MSDADIPRKFFWRRVVAFVVDWFLLSVLFGLITVAIQPLVPVTLSAPGFVEFKVCEDATDRTFALDPDEFLPLKEGEIRRVRFCRISHLGLTNHNVLSFIAVRKSGVTTYRRAVSYTSDEDGRPVTLVSVGHVMMLFAPFLLAALYGSGGRPPGKRLVRLAVLDSDWYPVTGLPALKRELLKWFPFMLVAAAALFLAVTTDPEQFLKTAASTLDNGLFYLLMFFYLVLLLATLFYWLFPFIRWRGQSYYDKWLRLYVVRRSGEQHLME